MVPYLFISFVCLFWSRQLNAMVLSPTTQIVFVCFVCLFVRMWCSVCVSRDHHVMVLCCSVFFLLFPHRVCSCNVATSLCFRNMCTCSCWCVCMCMFDFESRDHRVMPLCVYVFVVVCCSYDYVHSVCVM